jgi:hypothetical protein
VVEEGGGAGEGGRCTNVVGRENDHHRNQSQLICRTTQPALTLIRAFIIRRRFYHPCPMLHPFPIPHYHIASFMPFVSTS